MTSCPGLARASTFWMDRITLAVNASFAKSLAIKGRIRQRMSARLICEDRHEGNPDRRRLDRPSVLASETREGQRGGAFSRRYPAYAAVLDWQCAVFCGARSGNVHRER